jgi:tetratricopeptide (TPR) repeat protein
MRGKENFMAEMADKAAEMENIIAANIDLGVEGFDGEGDNDQNIAACDKAIQLNPKNIKAYELRGLAYSYKHDYDRAIADFGEAIKIDPKESIYYGRRGMAYGEKNDYVHAIADLNEAVRLDEEYIKGSGTNLNLLLKKTFAKTYQDRGYMYGKMKKYKLAIADFEKAVELWPDEEMYHNNLAFAKNKLKSSNKIIWTLVGAAAGGIIGGIVGGGIGVFIGAIIGAFPIPIIKFIGRWLSK